MYSLLKLLLSGFWNLHQEKMRMDIYEKLRERRDEIRQIAAKHGARNVRVFGSVARGEADSKSDLDLLVDMEPGGACSTWEGC